eukprot:GEMP01034753.1.p1 GENE.GEMP01034753.1~~GEMP01034753.1.p1  ORF type:complete len:399 (+),score=71.63 GEMP01034753.1:85-1281(+)
MVTSGAELVDTLRPQGQPNRTQKKIAVVPRRVAALGRKSRTQTVTHPVGLDTSTARGSSIRRAQSAAPVACLNDSGAKKLRFSTPFPAGKFPRAPTIQTQWEYMFGNQATLAEAEIERTIMLEEKAARKKSTKEKRAAGSAGNAEMSLFGSSVYFCKKSPPEDIVRHLDSFATKKLNDNCRSRKFSKEEFAQAQRMWCKFGGENRIADDFDWMDEMERLTGESKESLYRTPGFTTDIFKAQLQRPKTFDEFLDWYRAMAFCEFFCVPPAHRSLRALGRKYNISIPAVEHLRARFDQIDLNGSGYIDYSEFRLLMRNLFNAKDVYDLPDRRIWSYWCALDANGDGMVTFDEYLLWYYRAINAYSSKRNTDLAQQLYAGVRNLIPDERISSEVARIVDVA